MRWAPSVTVAAVIRNRAGDYLLVEESPDGTPVFNQPAGHLEAGESLLQAVVREVQEETCRVFSPSGLVGIYRWTVPETGKTYLRFCFTGTVGEETADCQYDPDILATHWIGREELENDDFALRSPMVMRCIKDADSTPLPLSALKDLDFATD